MHPTVINIYTLERTFQHVYFAYDVSTVEQILNKHLILYNTYILKLIQLNHISIDVGGGGMGVCAAKQSIQPSANQLRINVIANEELFRLMFHGSVVDLELAKHFERPHQLLTERGIMFEHTQCLGSGLQRAQTPLGWLGANYVIADAGRDQFHLFHAMQQRAAGVDGLGLRPRAIDQE